MEMNPSDVGTQDRLVVQELIKELAQTQQIDANATRKFKGLSFDLLIEVLEVFRLEGDVRPRRSKVGNELVRRNPLLYNRAGVENFKG